MSVPVAVDRPEVFQIETTSICNLRCPMCPYSMIVKDRVRPIQHIDPDLFKTVIDRDIPPWQESVGLHIMGEPTLNPMLPDLIAYASRKVKTEFSTNATRLTQTLSRLLIEAGLGTIWFALDACSPEVYDQIRIGGNYYETVSNIRAFLAIKQALHSNIEVIVQMVVMPVNKHEQDKFIKVWSAVPGVTYVSTKFLDSFAGSINNELVKAPKVKRFPCQELFERVVILSNGDVAPCCRDWSGAYSYGNVNDHSVEWIWNNSPALAELRAEHISGKYLSEPCKSCKEWHIPMDRHVANAETSEDFKGIPLVPTGG